MRKVNLSQVPVEENPPSPAGRFQSCSQNMSQALGHIKDSDSKQNSHPFDLELCRVPVGLSPCPYHAHSGQSELYLILSGSGKFRTPQGLTELTSGDAVFCAPGEPHQIINDGIEELVFYIIADNPVGETCYYLDSDKWGLPSNLNGPVFEPIADTNFGVQVQSVAQKAEKEHTHEPKKELGPNWTGANGRGCLPSLRPEHSPEIETRAVSLAGVGGALRRALPGEPGSG